MGVVIGVAATTAYDMWYVDARVALVVAAGLLVYGGYVLVKNGQQGNRWWRASFWQGAKVGVPSAGRQQRIAEIATMRMAGLSVDGGVALQRPDEPQAVIADDHV